MRNDPVVGLTIEVVLTGCYRYGGNIYACAVTLLQRLPDYVFVLGMAVGEVDYEYSSCT